MAERKLSKGELARRAEEEKKIEEGKARFPELMKSVIAGLVEFNIPHSLALDAEGRGVLAHAGRGIFYVNRAQALSYGCSVDDFEEWLDTIAALRRGKERAAMLKELSASTWTAFTDGLTEDQFEALNTHKPWESEERWVSSSRCY